MNQPLAALVLLILAQTAHAQMPAPRCLPYDAFIAIAEKQYGERPVLSGVLSGGEARLVIFANPQTGTFTTGLHLPSGQFCLHMAGDGMGPADVLPRPKGNDT